jgi:hypothetical protein
MKYVLALLRARFAAGAPKRDQCLGVTDGDAPTAVRGAV